MDLKLRSKYDNSLILAVILLDQTNDYEYFCHKYKISNSVKNRFRNISNNFENLKKKNYFSKDNIKKLIYFSNKDYVRDLLLFLMCESKKINPEDIEKLIYFVDTCKIPKFPISGDYLKEHGYKTGEVLGKKLKSLEELWIKNNFIIEKKIIDKSLDKKIKN